MTGRLSGNVVVVTGGANGIGRGCAEMLAHEGARLVIGDIADDAGADLAASIEAAGGEAVYRHADVTHEEDCAALMQVAVDRYGALHGLLNNVGWFPRATLEETTTELWDSVLAINLRGAFYCCKYAVPRMRASGKGGSIVNMGSINGIQGLPNLIAYSSAKGGLLALTRTLAGAHARELIRVNYVNPGWVLTDTEVALQTSRGLTTEDIQSAGEALPLRRHQTAEDVAYAVVYLLSDESAQVTGTALNVDAGVADLPLGVGGPYVG